MRIAAYVPDLMDRSRISAVAPDVRFVKAPADLVGADVDLVVVDLSRVGVIELAASFGPSLGFGSHVDRDRLGAARAAGIGTVLARSEFFSRLDEFLV